ncbi:Fic family protein [Salana multivorans]
MTLEPEALLKGTPYLVDHSAVGVEQFHRAFQDSIKTRERATRVADRIHAEASSALGPYLEATRTELVAESNVMEGYEWTGDSVRRAIGVHKDLIDGPRRTLLESVRNDPRVYEAIGLYAAQKIADDWSAADHSPRVHEIRELHRTILGDTHGSGQYKRLPNRIGGTSHRPAEPYDVERVMLEMADWWGTSEGDPLLTATVIHAWLAHIHPFDDGNGRLARILANLELARRKYPPLIVRPGSDRGEYYDALAHSDQGDILPLYRLFGRSLRKQTQLMARPEYVTDVITNRLLATEHQQFTYWHSAVSIFAKKIGLQLEELGLGSRLQGIPGPTDFSLLGERSPEGNSWFLKVFNRTGHSLWLLWFGFKSDEWLELEPRETKYPSIFISQRSYGSDAEHPYDWNYPTPRRANSRLAEISLSPLTPKPVSLRFETYDLATHDSETGAKMIADYLAAEG